MQSQQEQQTIVNENAMKGVAFCWFTRNNLNQNELGG